MSAEEGARASGRKRAKPRRRQGFSAGLHPSRPGRLLTAPLDGVGAGQTGLVHPPTPVPAGPQTAQPLHPRASGVEWCTRRREGPGSGSKRGPGARILGGPGFRVRSEQEPVGGSRGGTEVAPRVPLQRGPRWARPSAARSGQAWRGAAGGGERWRPRVWAPRSCSWAPRPAPCARVSACRGGCGEAVRDRVGAPLVSSRARARGRRGEGALRKTQSCARVPGPREGSRCGLPRPGGGRSGAPSLCPGTR